MPIKNQKDIMPCPTENEGNIVNVTSCCPENQQIPESKNYVFYEKEAPKKYCCFDVYITRCWLTHNKDWLPEGGLILQGYANEQTGTAPGLATYLRIHPKHGWVNLNQKIGSFKVLEGDNFPVLIRVDALEWGQGLDGASDVGSDLEGDDAGEEIVLSCNAKKVPTKRLAVKLQRPGGGDAGRVAVEIAAFRTSCCC